MLKSIKLTGGIILVAVSCLLWSCDSSPISTEPTLQFEGADAELNELLTACWTQLPGPPPSPMVDVDLPWTSLSFWPYTGESYSGQPQDPINLLFVGNADPRDIRAALFSLDGDRTAFGFPDEPPFNSTWDDAIGDVQTGYYDGGWVGGVVQLTCGDYAPLRCHLRLFRMGDWTVGNAHFETIIPGTTDHQVLSWELAEQIVIADFMRSGLLDATLPMMPTAGINQPGFREIPSFIYNLLPVELRAAIGGPLGDVSADVPIASDGHAMVLNLAGSVPRTAETRVQDFVMTFDQVVPKPFCASSPMDYVYVSGPVHLRQVTTLTQNGRYKMKFHASGQLMVTPVDPTNGQPLGPPLPANVMEFHRGDLTNHAWMATSFVFQKIIPSSDPAAGSLFKRLRVTSSGRNGFVEIERCPTM